MNIGNIKVWPTSGSSNLKANGVVTLNDLLNVKFAVIRGSKGLFVSWPQKVVDSPEGKKYYPDVSFPKNEEADAFRNKLTKEILDTYTKATGSEMSQGEAAGPDSQLPF